MYYSNDKVLPSPFSNSSIFLIVLCRFFKKIKKTKNIFAYMDSQHDFFCFEKSGILILEAKGGISCDIYNTIL